MIRPKKYVCLGFPDRVYLKPPDSKLFFYFLKADYVKIITKKCLFWTPNHCCGSRYFIKDPSTKKRRGP